MNQIKRQSCGYVNAVWYDVVGGVFRKEEENASSVFFEA